MREDNGNSYNEIDNFDITIPLPSDNQEEVFTGNGGIASITMSYDVVCNEPDSSTTNIPSTELIGTVHV